MAWTSSRYRMLRWTAILLFAAACFNAGANLTTRAVYVLEAGNLDLLWQMAVGLPGIAVGILTALTWWAAARVLTSAETALDSPHSKRLPEAVPLAEPAPVEAKTPRDSPPSVTLFRGRMPRLCRRLRALGTAVLVVELVVAGISLTGFFWFAIVWGSDGLLGPTWLLRQMGTTLASVFGSAALGLFVFAFTRVIARIGHAAAMTLTVDGGEPIE